MARRILIADNDAAYALALRELLSGPDFKYEFEVYLTETREDAEGLLDIQEFHVVVTDSRLCQDSGGDGMEFVGHIKHSHPSTRVIVLTSSLTPEGVVRAYGQGADLMLEKPLKINEFLLAVRTLGADERRIAV